MKVALRAYLNWFNIVRTFQRNPLTCSEIKPVRSGTATLHFLAVYINGISLQKTSRPFCSCGEISCNINIRI